MMDEQYFNSLEEAKEFAQKAADRAQASCCIIPEEMGYTVIYPVKRE